MENLFFIRTVQLNSTVVMALYFQIICFCIVIFFQSMQIIKLKKEIKRLKENEPVN